MADFVTVIKERDRMCSYNDNCGACPLDTHQPCRIWMSENPEKAEKIIMKWSMENPIVTNRMKLEEVFGFDVAMMFEPTTGNYAWLNSGYKNKEG